MERGVRSDGAAVDGLRLGDPESRDQKVNRRHAVGRGNAAAAGNDDESGWQRQKLNPFCPFHRRFKLAASRRSVNQKNLDT